MKKEAILYTKGVKEGFVKCLACHHYCQIAEWKTWICGVRKNENAKLYLLTWGQALGVNVDPIEKKPLFHFLPWSPVFSFGTAWCNFSCSFCQNWQMSQVKAQESSAKKENDWKIYVKDEVLNNMWVYLPPEKAISYCKDNNINILAYTYNEPTVFFEYAYDVMKLTRNIEEAKKIKQSNIFEWKLNSVDLLNVFVSNWFESDELWDKAEWYLDAINIDLKGFSKDFYKKELWGRLEPILDNIKQIYEKRHIFLEITTLIVPWENDSEEELRKMAQFVKSISVDIPWHLSAFHPDWKMLDKPITPIETLLKAYEIAKEEWLNYVYIWNTNLPDLESTYCPKCKEKLITRSWYVWEQVEDKTNNSWVCPKCATKIPWLWKENNNFIVRKKTIYS